MSPADGTIEDAILAGAPVPDPAGRCADAEFFLDEAEPDDPVLAVTRWVEADVPVTAVVTVDWPARLERLIRLNGRDRENERLAAIRAWAEREGGWENALAASPVILLYHPHDGTVDLVDGWHRAHLARGDGAATIRCLVGIILGDDDGAIGTQLAEAHRGGVGTDPQGPGRARPQGPGAGQGEPASGHG
jgi:hypothetical protein